MPKKIDNATMRIFLHVIQDVVGFCGLKSILNYTNLQKYIKNFPPDNNELEISVEELQSLHSSLYELFGQKGAHILQFRAGREFMRFTFGKCSDIMESVRVAARPLPEREKIYIMLEFFAKQAAHKFRYPPDISLIEILEDDSTFLYIDKVWFESDSILSDTPVCNFFAGMLHYGVEWMTGHRYRVKEVACKAMGDHANVFEVSKTLNK